MLNTLINNKLLTKNYKQKNRNYEDNKKCDDDIGAIADSHVVCFAC